MIDFIDLFSGIGGFRLGLERANEERRLFRQQNMHRHSTDTVECIEHGREASGRHISQESPRGSEIGLERANQSSRQTLSKEKWRQTCGSDLRSPRYLASNKATNGRSQYTFNCVWSCDNNRYANQIYTKQFGEANHHSGDIRGVDPGDIPDFDLLCAGFPCQAFSVAGKRKGFQDTRGTLFFEIYRIAEAKKPSLLLLENVKGLFSSERGQVFYTIIQSLEDLGYWVEWQVLNSKYFGVPQNRERVFIIGHLRGTGGREIFPIGETDEMAKRESRGRPPVQAEVGSAIHSRYGARWRAHGQEQLVSTAIDRNYYKGVDRHGQRTVIGVTLANTSRYRQGVKRTPLKKDENSFAINSTGDQGVAISFTNPHNPEEERKVNLSNLSRAVKPPYGNQQPLLIENLRIRRLTPVECERLQGFPDGWTEYGYVKDAVLDYEPVYGWAEKYDEETDEWEEVWKVIGKNPIDPIDNTVRISDTQRYKCLGNAVTVNVIEFLGELIKSQFKKNARAEDKADG